MFKVTSICHQGWLFSYENYHIAVDPLFHDSFGRGPSQAQYKNVYPPKKIILENFPKLNAIIISHEHEDHFHLQSLHWLDRSIPIFLSERSSVSAHKILKLMGFRSIHKLPAGQQISFGPFNFFGLTGDSILDSTRDEWDNIPYLIWDKQGHGSFLTPVDVRLTPPMLIRCLDLLKKNQKTLVSIGMLLKWTHLGQLTFQNPKGYRRGQYVTISKNLIKDLGDQSGAVPFPGMSLIFRKGKIHSIEQSSFIKAASQKTWMMPPKEENIKKSNFSPLIKKNMNRKEWRNIENHLQVYATYLFARYLYKALFSLSPEQLPKTKIAFAFILRSGKSKRIYEYDSTSAKFILQKRNKSESQYIASCVCWAADLLAVFDGAIEPRILNWNSSWWRVQAPLLKKEIIAESFTFFFHPLNRSEQVFNQYRKIVRGLKKSEIGKIKFNR